MLHACNSIFSRGLKYTLHSFPQKKHALPRPDLPTLPTPSPRSRLASSLSCPASLSIPLQRNIPANRISSSLITIDAGACTCTLYSTLRVRLYLTGTSGLRHNQDRARTPLKLNSRLTSTEYGVPLYLLSYLGRLVSVSVSLSISLPLSPSLPHLRSFLLCTTPTSSPPLPCVRHGNTRHTRHTVWPMQ